MPFPLALIPFLGGLGGLGGFLGKKIKNERDKVRAAGLDPSDPKNRTGIGKFFLGEKGGLGTYDLYTPEQQAAFSKVLGQGLNQLGQFKPVDFAPIAQQAREQFSQQTVPSIAERFTGLGAGAQSSSAFPQILGQAGAGLESSLAAQQAGFGLQQQDQQQRLLATLLGIGLQPQFASYFQQGTPGALSGLSGQLPGLFGTALGLFNK